MARLLVPPTHPEFRVKDNGRTTKLWYHFRFLALQPLTDIYFVFLAYLRPYTGSVTRGTETPNSPPVSSTGRRTPVPAQERVL